MRLLQRLAFVALFCFAAALPASAREPLVDGIFSYRGFSVDMAQVENASNRDEVEASLKTQLDIVADCGAKPEVMKFLRSQKMVMRAGPVRHGGRFSVAGGVELEAHPMPPDRPIVLHELLHAFHAHYLPDGLENKDVIKFYDNARSGMLYPAGAYVLFNKGEFFAITGSLYLFGSVARPPHDRETLRSRQPYYYEWLAQIFGVKK